MGRTETDGWRRWATSGVRFGRVEEGEQDPRRENAPAEYGRNLKRRITEMTNTNDRGLQQRKRRMMALRKELGFPKEAPITSGLAFAAIDDPNDEILCAIAQKAIAERQDTLIHCYPNIAATDPFLTVLVLRTANGAELLPVEIVQRRAAKPLQLITKDRTRCFRLDSRWLLQQTRVPSAAKLPKAILAAQARYDAALADTFGNHAGWDPQVVIFERGPASVTA